MLLMFLIAVLAFQCFCTYIAPTKLNFFALGMQVTNVLWCAVL